MRLKKVRFEALGDCLGRRGKNCERLSVGGGCDEKSDLRMVDYMGGLFVVSGAVGYLGQRMGIILLY